MLLQFRVTDLHFAIFDLSDQCTGPVSDQMPWESVGMLAKPCQDTDTVHVRALPGVCCHVLEDENTPLLPRHALASDTSPQLQSIAAISFYPDLTPLAQLAQQQLCQFIACHEMWSRGRYAGLHSEICWPCGREVRGEGQRLVPCWKYTATQSLSLRRDSICFSFCRFISEWNNSWRL